MVELNFSLWGSSSFNASVEDYNGILLAVLGNQSE